jgi:tetratricopeptide (TPR) repeat protein
MSGSQFIPNFESKTATAETEPVVAETASNEADQTGGMLLKVAQYAMIALLGLSPVFFMPGLWASLGFDKALMGVVLASVALIVLSFLALRKKRVNTVLPIPLMVFWGVVLTALLSALLSGDIQDAIRGSVFEPQTVGFMVLMGIVMSLALVFQGSKIMSIKALAVFGVVAALLLLYNVLRIFFGAAFLNFGSFGSVTVSPIGGFNDLAIFAGLTIILSLITLLQLPLKSSLQYAVSGLISLALIVLAVVNFFNIWIIIGFFGLLLLVYLLSRDTLFQSAGAPSQNQPTSPVLLGITALVCIFSVLFIVAGEYAGGKVGEWTNVNYVEVRPSFEATVDITQSVYSESILFGVGPNRFADAWRLHKDRSINETIFWDTDFNAGSGYIPTLFVTLGVLGGLLLLVFHAWFLFLGYKTLIRNLNTDSYWYYFGVISFSAAVFLWAMSYIYVPGAGVLLLTALFTGMSFVAYGMNVASARKDIPLAVNRQRGFVLMAAIIAVISINVGVLFSVGEQYIAQANFTESRATAGSIPEFEQTALSSFNMYQDDRFVSARAQIQLATLNSLVSIPEPSEEQQQQFLASAEQALIFAEQAVAEDPLNPDNFAVLAGVYSNLAVAGIEGAQDRAMQSIQAAQDLDPLNPGYKLVLAQMSVRAGDVAGAREAIAESLTLKRNFTEALFLSAQLDIADGNAEAAISTTRAIITLEPNNPTRYFQLGLLLSANAQLDDAIVAYQAAITLDPDYANARYLLALAYLNQNNQESALVELKRVYETNQENTQLAALISEIESGNFEIPSDLGFETPVSESSPIESDDTVLTEGDVETDLVTPVNTVSGSDDSEEGTEETGGEAEEEAGESTEEVTEEESTE